MGRKNKFQCMLIGLLFLCTQNYAIEPHKDTNLTVEERVNDLISRMTLAEKIAQLGHKSPAISRLGVASYNYWNEGIHGVARSGLATSFPVSIALSSTWNPELVYQVASVTADEARIKSNTTGKGLTYWSPTINMARDPRWGRSEENYGEDVYLTSRIGVSFIKGMQGNHPKYLKTVATVKHFVANNIEKDRYRISSNMDERNLREYYLPAFKACVAEGKVFSLMSAYNAVNGVPCPANRTLLTNILRKEWGFGGFVVSDCDAAGNVWDAHAYVATGPEATALSLQNGNDLNCGTTFPDNANSALSKGLMKVKDIDEALKRIFKARFLLGEFDPLASVPYTSIPSSKLDCREHSDLALQAAREAIVLLKNKESFLPLNKDSVKTIAVIGPNAHAVQLGGYSGSPSVAVSVLQGIANLYGIDISSGRVEAENYLSQNGIQTEVCNEGGTNVGYINHGDNILYDSIDFGYGKEKMDIRVASQTSGGNLELLLDGATGPSLGIFAISSTGSWQIWKTLTFDLPKVSGKHKIYLKFTGGSGYLFNMNWFRFYNTNDVDPTAGDGVIRYAQGCTVSGAKVQAEFDKAIGMAKSSDVAIVVLGTDLEVADESHDRSNITLPGVQEQLLKEVFQANPKTILVLVTGASLAVSWANDYLPAIICSWYNGQAQGTALSEVVFGQFNPKGKLTTTWYRSLADLPSFNDYNIRNNRTYMYFTGTPLFPFGYGLSYTTFEYSNLKISNNNLNKGDSVVISTDIRNSGTMTGTEIAQFYVQVESPYLVRPQKELKGFAQVTLEPGETRTVDFVLKHDALAYYDENDKTFVVETSKTHIMVGASSSDIRLKGSVMVTGAPVATTYRNNPFQQIEAETFENKSKTVKLVFCADSTQSLAGLTNNSYVAYKNMDFATGARQISLSLASLADDATVGIMLDSLDGILAGTLKVSNTGSLETYTEQSCGLAHTEGTRDLFLVFKTSKADALRVNWIRFDKTVSSGKIKENKESFFNLYPNPAKTKVKVDYCLNEMESAELSVYSMQGKLIKSVVLPGEGSGQYHSEFDCASLFPYQGLYLVRFNSVGFNKTMLISFVR